MYIDMTRLETNMQQLPPEQLQNLSMTDLINLVKHGMVSVTMTQEITIPYTMDKEEIEQKYAHLRGTPISISAAARKYNLQHPTISRWVKRGYIQRIGMDKNRVLIDEAQIAYCAEVYHSRPGQGHWLFDNEGAPYTPKRPRAD